MKKLPDIQSLGRIEEVTRPSSNILQIAYRVNGELEYTETTMDDVDVYDDLRAGQYYVVFDSDMIKPRIISRLTILMSGDDDAEQPVPAKRPIHSHYLDDVFMDLGAKAFSHRQTGAVCYALSITSYDTNRLNVSGPKGISYIALHDPIMIDLPAGEQMLVRYPNGKARIIAASDFTATWEKGQ